jgi:hypothetical protein
MWYKNEFGIWKYSLSSNIEGGMNNGGMNNGDFKSALDNRPRFALKDKIVDVKPYHIETYENDNGNIKKRKVRTQKDLDFHEKVVDALYSLCIFH